MHRFVTLGSLIDLSAQEKKLCDRFDEFLFFFDILSINIALTHVG